MSTVFGDDGSGHITGAVLNPDRPPADVVDLVALTVELTLDGELLWADRTARNLLGQGGPISRGVNWFEHCVDPEYVESNRAHLRRLVEGDGRAPITFEARCRAADGVVYDFHWHAVLARDAERGRIIRMTGALTSTDDPSPTLAAALEQLLDLRYALDRASIVAATDRKGVITYANDTFCAISGYSRDELLGRTHRIVNGGYHPRSFFKKMWATIGRGQVWRGDVCNRAKDGSEYWVATTIVPYLDRNGRPYRYLAIRNDITGRKRAEAALARAVDELEAANQRILDEQSRLLQAEKLSSVGLLAAGVAHEINNPLAGTMACVKQLRDGKVAEHRRATYFDTVLDGLDRIERIVSALLSYARPARTERGPVDVAELIDGCLLLIRPAMHKARVRVDHRRPEPPRFAHGDRQQLMQATMNVLINAVHASPEGGTIRVDHPIDGARVAVRVSDEGPGIPLADVDRVCDPFFSTKPEGTGTGLGLSVTMGIVQAHGGTLHIGRAAPHGAVVSLWLPTSCESPPTIG